MQKLLLALIALPICLSCIRKDNTSHLIIKLTDSPGDYDQVNIDLRSVEVSSDTNNNGGWQSLHTNEGIYNLLTLTNGVEEVIANGLYPSGKISQIRLLLGNQNSVLVNGLLEPLNIPSGTQTGIKINLNTQLEEGITYAILLDFDAAKSVIKNGSSGKYTLKPVIKAVTEAQDGAIKGIVTPGNLNVAIYAVVDSDTIGTSYASSGKSEYFIGGLKEGIYTIVFDPGESSGYQSTSVSNIGVALGKITRIDSVKLVL